MKYIVIILLFVATLGGTYELGKRTERDTWRLQVEHLTETIKEKDREREMVLNTIHSNYQVQIARLRQTLPVNPRIPVGVNTVRVSDNTCARTEATTPVPNGATEGTPTVSTKEWELENERRFEENRIQLEALVAWVTALYRTK